ncbi:MAG: NAD-dependent epimerase/dehydratase family protein [Kiritimatiellae bacterium]|nr:NAD-dependent epimerase/dehydratase family protein [Kiritimatiellia bacterium]
MNATILVTGAAGFIGSQLVASLSADGLPVRALVLPGSNLSNLKESGAEIVPGDIRDPACLGAAMRNIATVYHLAAISRHDAKICEAEYHAVNVEGTKNILESAAAAGVRRVVFTGTIEAVGLSRDGSPLTEDSPQNPRNIYGRTKLEAENLVRAFNSQQGVETVVVRPPMTYGPREMLLLTRMFKLIAKGFYPLIGSGKALTEFCYVKNQVHGIRLAADRGRPGEVYFISDERPYAIEEIIDAIAAELGVRPWKPHIPVPLARSMGLTLELLAKVLPFYPFIIPQTGRPPFSRKSVAWLSESRLFVDISKARRELGYLPVYDLAQGIRETVQWYIHMGLLRPPLRRQQV